MNFYSTKSCLSSDTNPGDTTPFEEAIFLGPAHDGGLFMPSSFPVLSAPFFDHLASKTIDDIGTDIIFPYTDATKGEVWKIMSNAFNFPAPLNVLEDGLQFLELFHGPTLAFKDFGARFMAQTMAFYRPKSTEINILVATSGDTGGAIASAFSGLTGFKVFILYPKGKVSPIQQRQLTTWDDNVCAIEVAGTFDDCQRMVKQVFADKDIRSKKTFGSANSINIARLLPQMVYYFEAYRQARDKHNLTMIVPSGNFGNLTAGLFAKRMGLLITQFIAATNLNDIVPEYLKTGLYEPRVSRETLANAMDVGDPSNFVRMLDLYQGADERSTWNNLKADVKSHVVDDKTTLEKIKEVYDRYGYIMDPHTAIAYDAHKHHPGNNIIVSTAHWAKFASIIEKAIGTLPELPKSLTDLLHKVEKKSMIKPEVGELVDIIL